MVMDDENPLAGCFGVAWALAITMALVLIGIWAAWPW